MKLSMRIILVVAAFLGALVTWQWQKPVAEIPSAAPNAAPEIPRASAEPARMPAVANREQEELPPLGPFATEEEAVAAIRERARELAKRSGPSCYNENGKAVIRDPNSAGGVQEIEKLIAQNNIVMQKRAASLEKTKTVSAQYTRAVLSDSPVEIQSAIENAIELAPGDPLLRWHHYRECIGGNLPNCDETALLASVKKSDPHNAETWINEARDYYAKGNTDSALISVQRGASSEFANSYWFESVEYLEQGLAAAEVPFEERAIAAFGIAAAKSLPGYSARLNMCREMGANSTAWARACFDSGKVAEKTDVTQMGTAIGLSMQVAVMDYLPQDPDAQSAKQRQADAKRRRSEHMTNQDHESANDRDYVVMSHPKIWREYINFAKQNGESAAQEFLNREIVRLRESGWRSPCEKLAAENAKPKSAADSLVADSEQR